ncbi:MAG: type II secretion system protein [Actinomycetota bacterium]
MHRPDRNAEAGFTLIEIMVVVLIIGLLIAIALPTFLGARSRAQDRGVQTDVRNAFLAERTFYTDGAVYTESILILDAIEPALDYVAGDTPAATGSVYMHVHAGPNELFVSGRSVSGTCFYLREIDGGGAEFASSAGCGVADTQTYTPAW